MQTSLVDADDTFFGFINSISSFSAESSFVAGLSPMDPVELREIPHARDLVEAVPLTDMSGLNKLVSNTSIRVEILRSRSVYYEYISGHVSLNVQLAVDVSPGCLTGLGKLILAEGDIVELENTCDRMWELGLVGHMILVGGKLEDALRGRGLVALQRKIAAGDWRFQTLRRIPSYLLAMVYDFYSGAAFYSP